jgi:ribosome-associated toxin RatA of RatAB toxin-antitoxin module
VNQVFTRAAAALAIAAALVGGLPPLPAGAMDKSEITTPPTASQEGQISRGEIVVALVNRHPIYHLDVYGAVDAPLDAVWSAITSYDDYKAFLPLVVESAVRKRAGDSVWQHVRMQPPWPLHDHWMVNVNVENRAKGRIAWTMADGNLRFERGYWQVTPMGPNRTKLQYHLTVDPWLDIVPGWLIEFATRSVLPDVIKGTRKRVKANVRG